jgi:hypothetical protein
MARAAKSPNSEKPRSERELKVTAALYAMLGVVPYLKEHGRLPDRIGGPWNYIPARILLQQRGPDLELTDDERLVYGPSCVRAGCRGARWFCWMSTRTPSPLPEPNARGALDCKPSSGIFGFAGGRLLQKSPRAETTFCGQGGAQRRPRLSSRRGVSTSETKQTGPAP